MSTPRLPFNPRDTAAARQASQAAASTPAALAPEQTLTISQLSAIIGAAVGKATPSPISVVGEVSGFRERTHWYFELKDAECVVSCAMFASASRKSGIRPRDGLLVRCRGRLEWYARSGKVTFLVDAMQIHGAGELDAKFRALVEEVRALGWFRPERKRPLPATPRRVAVLTSRSGAALQDVLVTMQRRCPAVGVLLVDVRVQGDVAAEIVSAIREVSRRADELGIDAVLLTRGGGSAEELFLFNDKEIARAIVECSVPVVAAIGHETDTTIAELVADERCATPTQAAMRLTPDQSELVRQLASVRSRLDASIRQRLSLERERVRTLARSGPLASPIGALAPLRALLRESRNSLERAAERRLTLARDALHRSRERLSRSRPDELLTRCRERLAPLSRSLHRAPSAYMQREGRELDALARQLDALSPFRTLERGYSITTTPEGHVLRRSADVSPGVRLRTRLAEGELESIVSDSARANPVNRREQPARKSPTPPMHDDSPPGLFS